MISALLDGTRSQEQPDSSVVVGTHVAREWAGATDFAACRVAPWVQIQILPAYNNDVLLYVIAVGRLPNRIPPSQQTVLYRGEAPVLEAAGRR